MKTLETFLREQKKVQSQSSLHDQLKELHGHATKNGLYDAADYLKMHIQKIDKKVKK
jgi:hypothetical protein